MAVDSKAYQPIPGSEETPGRRLILDEAAALFLSRGYAATSLRVIAERVGMKPASLYHHFPSKEALLEAIFARGVDVMVEAFQRAEHATRHEAGRVRFAAHVRAHLSALFENGPYTAVHVTSFRTAPPAVREAVLPGRDAYEAMWTALLEALRASGDLSDDTPVGLARLSLMGAMNSSVEWFDPERGQLDALAGVVARQFWTGMSRPRGGAARRLGDRQGA